jgi:hypothetical protein
VVMRARQGKQDLKDKPRREATARPTGAIAR